MEKQMKAAVIGIGVIGKVHLEVLAELNIRVTAGGGAGGKKKKYR